MEIHEYQAKELLRQVGIKTLNGEVLDKPDQAVSVAQKLGGSFWVVKAQVHAGGRGLGGGIKKARSHREVQDAVQSLIGHSLVTPQTGKEGKIIHQVLVEEGCNIEKEFYLALLLDRTTESYSLIVSSEGGMSIEEVAKKSPKKIIKLSIDPLCGLMSFHVQTVLKGLNMPSSLYGQLNRFLQLLYRLMKQKSATLIEINPLVLTKEEELLPLDAKMSIDDNALFRQPDMKELMDLRELPVSERTAATHGLSFVKLSGNIGCLVNGAGLAMATMDIVKLHGAEPANFLDVGGGVDSEKIDIAFKILKEDPQVKGILVNIFGGIVKCDLIAKGLVKAVELLNITMPVVVRLEGTNSKQARQLLKSSGLNINFADNLNEAARQIIQLTGIKK